MFNKIILRLVKDAISFVCVYFSDRVTETEFIVQVITKESSVVM